MTKSAQQAIDIINAAKRMALDHREGVYNAALTISGGALVLSLSFVEYFSFRPETFPILKIAWLILATNIILNVVTRYLFTEITIINIHKDYIKLTNPTIDADTVFEQFKPERIPALLASICFKSFWVSFVGGLLTLLYFVWINT